MPKIFCALLMLAAFAAISTPQSDPLSDVELDRLMISIDPELQAEAGKTVTFKLQYRPPGMNWTHDSDIAAVWRAEPAEWAAIGAANGELKIKPETPHGTVLTITADVLNGRRILTQKLVVYTSTGNPLAGVWAQEGALGCNRRELAPVGEIVKELVFKAGGSFSVTYDPFETYKDFWGKYTFDIRTGRVQLSVEGGNQVPSWLSAAGKFQVVNGKLRINGINFHDGQQPRGVCGSVFRRF